MTASWLGTGLMLKIALTGTFCMGVGVGGKMILPPLNPQCKLVLDVCSKD